MCWCGQGCFKSEGAETSNKTAQGLLSRAPTKEVEMARIINGELHDIWYVEDVIQCAKDNGKRIGKKQAVKVLQLAADRHDCAIGINWDVLEFWIDYVLEAT